MIKRIFVVLIIALTFLAPVFALKNVCRNCRIMAETTDTLCKNCNKPLNQCLECKTENPVENNFCLRCGEPLAEMRVLSTIDEELREELKLGQSDRAQLESELSKLRNQLSISPEKAEIYQYRIAKIYKGMKFFAREAQEWQDYLNKFPENRRKNRVKAYLSEALRQWGYLFYQQRQKENALEKFTESVAMNPLNFEAWMWVGRVNQELKRNPEAGEAYLSALKAQPGNGMAMKFLKNLKKDFPKELRKPGPPRIDVPAAVKQEELTQSDVPAPVKQEAPPPDELDPNAPAEEQN